MVEALPPPPPTEPAPLLAGVVTSRVSKVVTADFEGRIEAILVQDGQRVHAGDVVARLDTSALRTKLAQAHAQRQTARAQAARAGAVAHNAARRARVEQRLARVGAASREAHRNAIAEASAAAAEGGVAAGQIRDTAAQIAELEALIAAAEVRAPFDGIASAIKVKEGEVARKGTPIARVFDPGALVIRFAVARNQLSRVRVGDAIELATTDGRTMPGVVQRPLDQHDPSINLVVFEASLAEAGRADQLRVGDTGHVRVRVTR